MLAIRNYLMSFDHINRIHDLHVWPLSTTEIAHSTIQLETSTGENGCMLDG